LSSRRSIVLLPLLFLVFSCGRTYIYQFPPAPEKRVRPLEDWNRWHYQGSTLLNVPVVDLDGNRGRLAVGPKTKLEVKTIYGDLHRFQLQSIVIDKDAEGIFGMNAKWTGYDLLQHASRTVFAKEIESLRILSPEKAVGQVD
jgi:hypothetical protein